MRDLIGDGMMLPLAVACTISIIIWPLVFYLTILREVQEIKRALVIISFMVGSGEEGPDPDIADEEEKAEMNVILFGRKAA